MQLITNMDSAVHWLADGWHALGTYELIPVYSASIIKGLSNADIVFWTSFQQFKYFQQYLKQGVKHFCLSGKTARLLKEAAIEPVLFPTIKAFQQWRTASISVTAGE
jgi:uroporphyrinogen-III synthase